MQALSPLADKLKEHHTRLVFVGSSTVDQMEEFMRSPTVLMSGELYSDPTTSLYKTFHMKRGRFRSLVMPIWNSVSRYGWSGAVEGVKLGLETSHLAGDSWIQGGTLLLNQDGNILYQHQEEHPADWPDMTEVLRVVGLTEVPVDYDRAVSEWMHARQNARK